jgi:hypothetical protein
MGNWKRRLGPPQFLSRRSKVGPRFIRAGVDQAAKAGSIANAKDWTLSDINVAAADGSAVKLTDSADVTGLPTEAQNPKGNLDIGVPR